MLRTNIFKLKKKKKKEKYFNSFYEANTTQYQKPDR